MRWIFVDEGIGIHCELKSMNPDEIQFVEHFLKEYEELFEDLDNEKKDWVQMANLRYTILGIVIIAIGIVLFIDCDNIAHAFHIPFGLRISSIVCMAFGALITYKGFASKYQT